MIWKTDLIPHENKSGGKGGPQVVTTTYSASFDIVICESRGDHSLGRVWVNGQLKGDYRAGAASVGDLPLVFYDGNDEQMPDPTEEGIIGVRPGARLSRRGAGGTDRYGSLALRQHHPAVQF